MRLTPSGIAHAKLCAWAYRDEVQPPRVPPNEHQALGNAVDAAITATLRGEAPDLTDDAVLAAYVRWQEWWALWEHAWPAWDPQVPLAYDVRTSAARLLASAGHREYGALAATEIPGTLDAMRIEPDRVRIVDWKVGDDHAGYAAPVESNAQLAAYALMAARACGRDRATVHLVRIGSAGVTCETRDLDDVALEDVADELAALVARVPTAQPQPGMHCGRCKAAAVCPEAKAATDALLAPGPVRLEIATHEQASALLARVKLVNAAVEQVDAAVKAFAEANGGIRLPNGKVWRQTVREGVKLTAEVADMLREEGLDAAIEQPPARTSKAAIDRAGVARYGADRWKAKADEVRARLIAAEAIQTVPAGWREVVEGKVK